MSQTRAKFPLLSHPRARFQNFLVSAKRAAHNRPIRFSIRSFIYFAGLGETWSHASVIPHRWFLHSIETFTSCHVRFVTRGCLVFSSSIHLTFRLIRSDPSPRQIEEFRLPLTRLTLHEENSKRETRISDLLISRISFINARVAKLS